MQVMMLGHGGIKKMYELTGLSRPTIIEGIKELKTKEKLADGEGIRCSAGGRKKIEERNPEISKIVKQIMNETKAGDPMSLLKWTSKSIYQIRNQIQNSGYSIGKDTMHRRLKDIGYSLEAKVKVREGGTHKDRDSHSRYINSQEKEFIKGGNPVVSVDAKKKERIGDFKNPGKRWRPKGSLQEVNVYDYPSLSKGTTIPYGTYNIQKNNGVVNVGISHEGAGFAVESIKKWWKHFGHYHYPNASGMLMSAEGGGNNGSGNRAWRFYLQLLSDEISLPITICHYPPGTSKWNKIEQRMFSFVSMNSRGQLLINFETVVNMISATTTKSGLKMKAFLDRNDYKTAIKISCSRERN